MIHPEKIAAWFTANSIKITFILLALVSVVIVFSIIANHYAHKNDELYNRQRKALMDSVIYYKSKTGSIVAKTYYKTAYESSPEDLRKIDSLRKELGLKKKEIDTYIGLIEESNYINTGKRDSIVYLKDSTKPIYHYSFAGDYLKYKAAGFPDSLKFYTLQTRDSLYIVNVRKKVGKKEYEEINILHSNPYTTITGVNSISIPVQKEYSKISIGIHAGMDVFSKKPVVSVGINYDIIRFKKKVK